MNQKFKVSRETQSACLLGIAAVTLNLLGRWSFGPGWPGLGYILLFISAGALGLQGALISCALAVVPEMLFSSEQVDTLRVLAIAVACAMFSRDRRATPLFSVTLGVWVLILAPVFASLVWNSGWEQEWRVSLLAFLFLWDMTMATIAGCLLLSPTVWGWLTARPRHVTTYSLLIHAMTLTALVPALLMFLMVDSREVTRSLPITDPAAIVAVCLIAVGLAMLAAGRLAELIPQSSDAVLHNALFPKARRKLFSGLMSELLRRDAQGSERNSVSGTFNIPVANPPTPPAVQERQDANSSFRGLCVLTRDGTVSFMNHAFKVMAGITQNEITGKRLESLNLNTRVKEAIDEVSVAAFNGASRATELKLNELPHALRFLLISAEKAESSESNGSPSCVLISLDDITQRRTVEYGVMQEQKVGALGSLVRGMSHAFNNVLTTIAGQASYAQHVTDPEVVRQSLDRVVAACREAGSLVRQLLQFAEIRPAILRHERFDKILQQHVDLLRRTVGETFEIEFTTHTEKPVVLCDRGLISQVMMNLVLNARNSYQQKMGKIWISLDAEQLDDTVAHVHPGAKAGPCARIRVRDEGRGMTAEVLSRALDPSAVNKPISEATNLSLATAFAIVRAHDGFMTVESHPEHGTTVSVYFPLSAQNLADENVTTEVSPSGSHSVAAKKGNISDQHEGILVVEDDDNIREVVTSMLTTLGYKVEACSGGDEALTRCKNHKFDLVVADMVMPRMHGLELLEKLHASYPTLKTLLMTGSGYVSNSETISVLPKPFDLDGLAQAVKASIHNTRQP